METIYLDHNATTPVHPEVVAAMQPYWSDTYGNSASRHQVGQQAWAGVDRARSQIATWLDVHPDDIIFTSGATEANFTALLGRFQWLVLQDRKLSDIKVAVSAIEHPCVHSASNELRRRGATVATIPVKPEGIVDLRFFNDKADWDIVSVMAVNHEVGTIQPLNEIAQCLNPEKTFFHSDVAQWAGRIPGTFPTWGVNAISICAHKMYGPKGIGCLVVKRDSPIEPLFAGAQESGMRAGTLNVSGIVGFGKSAELAHAAIQDKADQLTKHLLECREALWEAVSQSSLAITRTIAPELSLPNTLHVCFPGIKAERLVDALDRVGIACSSGPACSSGASEPSRVLKAMGFSAEESIGGIRFSLGRSTTLDQIRVAGERILECLTKFNQRET